MNISKSLFKNLTRCDNFLSLYNMYINKSAHDVQEINGNVLQIKKDLEKLPDDLFSNDLTDSENDILSHMIDPETGEDLTITDNAQLEAFKDIFVDVEKLAIEYCEKLFNIDIIANTNTFEQKKFEYVQNGNNYYTYLDGYSENSNKIKVFEVKATTSNKFDKLDLKVTKKQDSKLAGTYQIFEKKDGINNYVGDKILSLGLDKEIIDSKESKIINRFRMDGPGRYIYDISISRNIIENYYKTTGRSLPEIEYYLVVLNSKYIYDGSKDSEGNPIYNTSKDGEDLFAIYDMNHFTKIYQPIIEKEKRQLEANQEYMKITDHCFGDCCCYKYSSQCKFINVCYSPTLVDGSILDFTKKDSCFKSINEVNKQGKPKTIKLPELLNNHIYTMKQARPYISKPDQLTELDCYESDREYINITEIINKINEIQYPIYHLDFESYNCPLPRFKGEKPYTQSLFQYSLHIEKEPGVCDIVNNHYEYLAPDHEDHRKDLMLKLIHDIDLTNGGCVMVYNENFEKTRLKEMANIYPDIADQILNIRDHVFDLLNVLDGKGSTKLDDEPSFNYYNKGLHGSFSIKKVLPLFTTLTYADLNVKNGTEAILAYGQFDKLGEEEYNNLYQSLRVYCRQDTWAMVKILEGLREKIKTL